MKPGSFKEDFFIIFIAFWTAIISTRFFTFEYYKVFRDYPVFYFSNTPIHHFLIGLLLVAAVLSLRLITNKFSLLSLVFLGIGLGLIADEFYLIITGNFTQDNIYWAGQNLAAIMVFGIISFTALKILELRHVDAPKIYTSHENPKNPHISVVVPAYNEEKYLAKNLSSIISQTYKNFELIVVDNASTDKTVEIAKSFGAKVISCTKKGVGAARQAGFMSAKGEIIATTDADNILPDNWLKIINKAFEKDKKMVAYGGLFRFYSGPLSARIAIKYFTYFVFQIDRMFSGKWSLIAQNMAVKKSAFLEVGGFKDFKIGEDADLSQRLADVGKVKLDPHFLVYASGRRAKHGLWYGAWSYAPNGLSRMFFKSHKFDHLPTSRTDQSILAELSVIPLIISVVYLLFLFTTMNTKLGDAQEKLLERTTTNISITKLQKIAKELRPTDTLQNFYEETKDYFLQKN